MYVHHLNDLHDIKSAIRFTTMQVNGEYVCVYTNSINNNVRSVDVICLDETLYLSITLYTLYRQNTKKLK